MKGSSRLKAVLKKWLRNTAVLVVLAVLAVAAVKLAQPWISPMPVEQTE